MESMPRPLPPRVQHQVTRHGKTVWYLRPAHHGSRVRLPMGPGEPGFEAAYARALAAATLPDKAPKSKGTAGTLSWLIDRYRETSAWSELAAATRRQRECIFRQVEATAGREPLARMTRKAVVAGLDRRRKTPIQARHYLDTLRGLFQWAVDAEHMAANPAEGVKAPSPPKSDGFPPWMPEDIAKFEARWPVGTRERVAFDVLRYTGLRRGDAVRLGRPHVRDGVIYFRSTEKTGEDVTIRLLPALSVTLEAGPVGELTYVTGIDGRPFKKESFGNWFRDACRAAGVQKSPHGLRKWFATRLAEEGATSRELQAACGWTSARMAELYTRSADRARLGLAASQRLTENTKRTNPPSPEGKVRAPQTKP